MSVMFELETPLKLWNLIELLKFEDFMTYKISNPVGAYFDFE